MALDERLYGIAPQERDVHDGVVYLTMVGVLKRLDISETTLRKNPALMALRKSLGPRTYRWNPADIDAYMAAQDRPLPDARVMKRRLRSAAQGHRGIAEGRKRGKARDQAMQAIMAEKLRAYHAQGDNGGAQ